MEFITPRGRFRPNKKCRLGTNCTELSKEHFLTYSHVHLERIIKEKSANDSDRKYKIPSELIFSRNVILEQLKVIESMLSIPVDRIALPSTSAVETQKTENMPEQSTSTIDNNICEEDNEMEVIEHIELLSLKEKLNVEDFIPVVIPPGKMAEKLEKAAPYNYFLTTITSSPKTHREPLSITFQEIFDHSLGEIESTVQISFLVDIGWLLTQYYFAGILDKPLLVLHGWNSPSLETISQKRPQVTAELIELGNVFACHHSKMMLLGYTDKSMRVVILTANLTEDDWDNRTQGLWMSPRCNQIPQTNDIRVGESPTNFRQDLLRYLKSYDNLHLKPWIDRIQRSDFSAVNVFLIASVSGLHKENNHGYPYGHAKLGYVLSKHSAPIEDTSPVVAQASSIGSFAPTAKAWLLGEFMYSLQRDCKPIGERKMPEFKMIFPTVKNILDSHDGVMGGMTCSYPDKTHERQLWLMDYLYQWKADNSFRSQAVPHIKTYARWTDNKLHWFLLTSANMSKAAWGVIERSRGNKNEKVLSNFNYEAGVLFLPKFVIGLDYFPLGEPEGDEPAFPILYDVPLTKYESDDEVYRNSVVEDANENNDEN